MNNTLPLLQDFPIFAPAIIRMIGAIGWCIGVWTVLQSIQNLAKYGELGIHSETSPGRVLFMLMIATLLVNLPSLLETGSVTLFGSSSTGSENPFAYSAGGVIEQRLNQFWITINLLAKILGLSAIINGLLTWKKIAEGRTRAGVAKGWWHLGGGVFAWHLGKLITVAGHELGWAVS